MMMLKNIMGIFVAVIALVAFILSIIAITKKCKENFDTSCASDQISFGGKCIDISDNTDSSSSSPSPVSGAYANSIASGLNPGGSWKNVYYNKHNSPADEEQRLEERERNSENNEYNEVWKRKKEFDYNDYPYYRNPY